MSTTYLTPAVEAADQVFEAVVKAQDATIDAVSTFTANLPEAAKNVPALPETDLPTAQEIASTYFEFAEKILSNQKAFVDRFFAATTVAS